MINKNEILKLAELARLRLTPEEINQIAKDETNILNYIDQINNLNLKETVEDDNRQSVDLRPDQPDDFSFVKDLIKEFPVQNHNFLKIPSVFEK